MALRLILVVAALIGLWLGWRWLGKTSPEKRKKTLILGGLGLLVVFGVVLLATGKLAGLFALAAGLSPWIYRAMRLHALWKGFQRMTGSAQAEVPPPASTPEGPMTRKQAYEILGLEMGASDEAVKEAHKRLMRANHPDSGGSTWIAARLNQARDLLLG